MKRLQIILLIVMVILFFVYVALDIYAWPLSKFAENLMQGMWAVILILIDPKELLNMVKGEPNEKDDRPIVPNIPVV